MYAEIPNTIDYQQLQESAFTAASRAAFDVSMDELATLEDVYRNHIDPDKWLPNGESYRQRAYQCYELDLAASHFSFVDNPKPYRQSLSVNRIAGGIDRQLRALPESHPATAVALKVIVAVTKILQDSKVLTVAKSPQCVVDVHYMRVTAPGNPSPEGTHRDGLLAGSTHLVSRQNLSGGASSIHSPAGEILSEFTLTEPLDCFIFDDERVLHRTDSVEQARPDKPGHRDVLVLGWKLP